MARFRKNDFFKWAQKIKSVFCFNPHTHEGCDQADLPRYYAVGVSIHTPTKGVTVSHVPFENCRLVSIHTPTKGVTNHVATGGHGADVSIHTPTKGVTGHGYELATRVLFQSTHPRRV